MDELGAAEPLAAEQPEPQADAADNGAGAEPGAEGNDAANAFGAMLVPAVGGEGAEDNAAGAEAGEEQAGDGNDPRADPRADPEDEGEAGAEADLIDAATYAGCLTTFTEMLPAMCKLLNVPHITVVLLASQIIDIASGSTTLGVAKGTDRIQAATAYASMLLAVPGCAPRASPNAIASTLLAVADQAIPQPTKPHDRAVRVAAEREGSPDTGWIKKMLAVTRASKECNSNSKEFNATEMRDLADGVSPILARLRRAHSVAACAT